MGFFGCVPGRYGRCIRLAIGVFMKNLIFFVVLLSTQVSSALLFPSIKNRIGAIDIVDQNGKVIFDADVYVKEMRKDKDSVFIDTPVVRVIKYNGFLDREFYIEGHGKSGDYLCQSAFGHTAASVNAIAVANGNIVFNDQYFVRLKYQHNYLVGEIIKVRLQDANYVHKYMTCASDGREGNGE
jgi:hypothetical protein